MLRYIIWTFIFYWLFRFIFNFLVPVFRATRQMKQQVNDFKSRMDGQGNYQGASTHASSANSSAPAQPEQPAKGDYIDFEEVK
jgi:hypothetical protein